MALSLLASVCARGSEQAGDGVLREPDGIAVPALLGEVEEDERVVREGVTRFARGAGFHLVIRPAGHFADAAADEIGDGDLRGEMDVAGERIVPPPAQQAIYFGRSVEVAAEAFRSKVDARPTFTSAPFRSFATTL